MRGSYHDGNLALSLAREEPLLDPRSRSVRRALEADRRFYDRMDVLLPMSEWLRRSFVADFGQSPEKVVTVGAGANLHEVPELPERDYESPRILFVGKQWERKGGPQLLEAFRLVRAERPDAELWVVGPEQAPAAEAGVRFLGRISRATPDGERRLGEVYAGATMFAMPSLYEPFGIVFLEAMAYGLACVASDRCAMPEIVDDGATGYVVPARDVGAAGAAAARSRRPGAGASLRRGGAARASSSGSRGTPSPPGSSRRSSAEARADPGSGVPELGDGQLAQQEQNGQIHQHGSRAADEPVDRREVRGAKREEHARHRRRRDERPREREPERAKRRVERPHADPEVRGHVDGEREPGADRAGDDPDPRDQHDVDDEVDQHRRDRRREPPSRLPEVIGARREERTHAAEEDVGRERPQDALRVGVARAQQQVDDRPGPDEAAGRATPRSRRSGNGL